jgi:hypothetical protein
VGQREEDIVGELVVEDGGVLVCLGCPEADERLEQAEDFLGIDRPVFWGECKLAERDADAFQLQREC